MTEPSIDRVHPFPAVRDLSDAQLRELYDADAGSPWLRVNFVSSLDGAATQQGLSGGLSGDADRRVFDLLRQLCDVVVVGAGTVRTEGYGALRVDEVSQRIRREAGRTDHPVFAIVSAALDLDPASPIFRLAPQRPIVATVESTPLDVRETFAAVADVVVCGRERVEPDRLVGLLAERGLKRIHCEGGPHLFGDLIAADAVDELCLTLSPVLEAGAATRIAAGAAPALPSSMRLAHVLHSADTLLLRYRRVREKSTENARVHE